MRAAPVAALVLSALLAGCSGTAPDDSVGADGDAEGMAGAAMDRAIRTPHPGGVAYTRDYRGLAAEDPTAFQGIPGGPVAGPVQTCCLFSWAAASDLFEMDQLVALRLTLNWTNEPQNMANLDLAMCVPWFCDFTDQPDQTNLAGPHSETFDLISGGRSDFLDSGNTYVVGARYSNAVFTSGLPFTVHVEAVPIANGLAFLDPYEVKVPHGGNLTAELTGPIRGSAITAALLVYGTDDRPMAYHELQGTDGSRHDLGHGPGTYVVVPFGYDGGFVRLLVNSTEEPPAARRLQETFGVVEVAVIADPAEHSGTFRFDAPPGSLDTFPFFLVDTASLQVAGVSASSRVTLASSTGTIADVDVSTLGGATPLGQSCLNCNTMVDWVPGNYLDDDGSYDIEYSSTYAIGRFVLFTATYSR